VSINTVVSDDHLPSGGRQLASPVDRSLPASIKRAYGYLNFVMDAYDHGGAPRLLQSYNNEAGLFTTGFVYDNALAIMAYLANPTADHLRRAKILGDSLLFAQRTDAAGDGRLRQAYFTGPLIWHGGGPLVPGFVRSDAAVPAYLFGLTGTATGDAAWVGMALAHLYSQTNEQRFLDGAVAIGNFICETAASPYRFGGYLGGLAADGGTPHQWSSTEHNIDCYGFFQMLTRLTGRPSWQAKAMNALAFVEAMWHDRFFYTGSQDSARPYPDPLAGLSAVELHGDPDAVNKAQIPADAQTWSYLALGEYRYCRSLDWALAHLSTSDTSASAHNELPAGHAISGITFSDRGKALAGVVPGSDRRSDRDAVWLEGTAHLAAALMARHKRGRHGQGFGQGVSSDFARAHEALANLVLAQAVLGTTAADRRPVVQTVGPTSRDDGALCDPAEGGTVTGIALPPAAGIVAASSPLDTGYGFGYFPNQHVGTTAWFVLAAVGANPFALWT
jgi:hypothetical protein